MKLGDCFKSGLHIGIGFVGIGLVIGLMLDSIGPAAKAMAEQFQINLHVVDVGWPGSSPMTGITDCTYRYPCCHWRQRCHASDADDAGSERRYLEHLAHDLHRCDAAPATGSYWLGILGVVVHAAFVYKLGTGLPKTRGTSSVWKGSPSLTARQLTSAQSPFWSIRLSIKSRPEAYSF